MAASYTPQLQGHPIHPELTAPVGETQPYHLPWADPDCPGMGEAPKHLQFLDEIIMWGYRAEEIFQKWKEIFQILLKAGFTLKQKSRDWNTGSQFWLARVRGTAAWG